MKQNSSRPIEKKVVDDISSIFKVSKIMKRGFIILLVVNFIIVIVLVGSIIYKNSNEVEEEPQPYYNYLIGNKTKNNDYVVLINKSNPLNECPIEYVSFSLRDLNGSDLSNGEYIVINIVGKSIDNETFIVFQDNDGNGRFSRGDSFIIKSKGHIDDDGYPSPGFAETGCIFEIFIAYDQVMIIKL